MAKSELYLYTLYYNGKESLNNVAKSDAEGVYNVLWQMVAYGKDKGYSDKYVIQRRPFQYNKPLMAVDKIVYFNRVSSHPVQYDWYQVSMKTGKIGKKHRVTV